MSSTSLLIANRGEIAIRVMRTATELGIRTVTVFSEDDANSLHTRMADLACPLRGLGVGAYLDVEQLLATANQAGCDAVHPGYGFLSENAPFARRCAEQGVTFVGPSAETLEVLGDKVRARALAEECGVTLLPGTRGPTTLAGAREFLESLGDAGSIMIKAVAGGGGRGLRPVSELAEVETAYERCRSEARAAFGNGDVYVEQLLPHARHVEVQIIGDGSEVSQLGERECSLQRRHQKLVEIAPGPGLPDGLRRRILEAAVRLAKALRFENVGTFEFLVDATSIQEGSLFAFLEANPRLQVEHTVTEEVTGIDLVKVQLQLASGSSLSELGLLQADVPEPRGFALQARINMETMGEDGTTHPSAGTLTAFEIPSGPGIRTDSCGYVGYRPSPSFDSLLAKIVARTPSSDFADVVTRAYRALCEFKIEGVATNVVLLQNLLQHPELVAGGVYTRFVEDHIEELVAPTSSVHQRLYFDQPVTEEATAIRLAGAQVDSSDPLAVLDHGKQIGTGASAASQPGPTRAPPAVPAPEGTVAVTAPVQGTIVSLDVAEDDLVHVGQQLLVMESMKMEHVVRAETSGIVRRLAAAAGDTLFEGHPLLYIEEAEVGVSTSDASAHVDLDHIRPDLAEVLERHAIGLDAARPESVGRRRKTGQRTTRENVEDLCDPGSFVEYGPLVIAAQRRRRSIEDLIARTPADGMVAGIGKVNGDLFGDRESQCVVMSYDYTVLAGTQGLQNHRKKDRMFELAEQ